MKDKNINDLRNREIKGLLISLSLPAIIGNFVQALYSFVDSMFISRMVNEYALAAVSQGMPIILIGFAFTMIFGMGGSMLFSIYLGKQDYETAREVKEASFVSMFISVSIFVIVSMFLMDDFIKLLKIKSDIAAYLKDYYGILIPGRLVFVMGFAMINFTRSEGYAKKAMKYIMLGAVLNTAFDPILISFLGIKGAAYATVFAQFVTASLTMRYHYKYSPVKMQLNKLNKRHFNLALKVFKNGFSQAFRLFAIAINFAFMNKVLNHIAKDDQGIYSSILGSLNAISNLVIIPIIGMASGMQAIIGYNFGAKQFNRVKETLGYSLLFSALFSAFLQSIIFLFSRFFISFFIKEDFILKKGIFLIKVFFFMLIIKTLEIIFIRFFQSLGLIKLSNTLLILKYFIISIPFLIIIPHFFGVYGIFYSMPASDLLSFLIVLISYFIISNRKLS